MIYDTLMIPRGRNESYLVLRRFGPSGDVHEPGRPRPREGRRRVLGHPQLVLVLIVVLVLEAVHGVGRRVVAELLRLAQDGVGQQVLVHFRGQQELLLAVDVLFVVGGRG